MGNLCHQHQKSFFQSISSFQSSDSFPHIMDQLRQMGGFFRNKLRQMGGFFRNKLGQMEGFFHDNLYIAFIAFASAMNIAEWMAILFLVYQIDLHFKEPTTYIVVAVLDFCGSLIASVVFVFPIVYFIKRGAPNMDNSMSIDQTTMMKLND
jgi:hypothetical protein